MGKYQILLKSGTIFIFKGNVILFDEEKTWQPNMENTVYINNKEVVYIKVLKDDE